MISSARPLVFSQETNPYQGPGNKTGSGFFYEQDQVTRNIFTPSSHFSDEEQASLTGKLGVTDLITPSDNDQTAKRVTLSKVGHAAWGVFKHTVASGVSTIYHGLAASVFAVLAIITGIAAAIWGSANYIQPTRKNLRKEESFNKAFKYCASRCLTHTNQTVRSGFRTIPVAGPYLGFAYDAVEIKAGRAIKKKVTKMTENPRTQQVIRKLHALMQGPTARSMTM